MLVRTHAVFATIFVAATYVLVHGPPHHCDLGIVLAAVAGCVGGVVPDLFHGSGGRAFASHSLVTAPIMALAAALMIGIPTTVVLGALRGMEPWLVLWVAEQVYPYALAGVYTHLLLDAFTENGVYVSPGLRARVAGARFDDPSVNWAAVAACIAYAVAVAGYVAAP